MSFSLQGLGAAQQLQRTPDILFRNRQAKAQRQQEERANAIAVFQEQVKVAEENIKGLLDQGIDPTPFANAVVKPLLQSAMLADGGVEGVNTQFTRARLQGLLESAGPQELLQAEAERERTLAESRAAGTAAGTPPGPVSLGTRVISGESQLNQRFGLGINAGESGRVEFLREPDGNIRADVKGKFGGDGVTVINQGESEFQKNLLGDLAKPVTQMQQAGLDAVNTEVTLRQMVQELKNSRTGVGIPTVNFLQGVANTFGLDLQKIADASGIELGKLSSQEEFDRLANILVVSGFKDFKGNLNAAEVRIAKDLWASLGRSKAANEQALAAGLAMTALNRRRALDALLVDTKSEARALVAERLSSDTTEFSRLKDEFLAEIRGGNTELPEGIPQGSVPIAKTAAGETIYQSPDGQQWVD